MHARVIDKTARSCQKLHDRGACSTRLHEATAFEVGGQVCEHLAMEVCHEYGCGGLLPYGRQPRHRLFEGRDRIARALRFEHEFDAERRIDSFPERDVQNLAALRFGGLVVGGQAGCEIAQLGRHFGRLGGGPQIHPPCGHRSLVEERPAHLAAGSERPLVELLAGDGLERPEITGEWQTERSPGLEQPQIEEGMPAPTLGERGGECGEEIVAAAHGLGGERFEQIGHARGSNSRSVSGRRRDEAFPTERTDGAIRRRGPPPWRRR